VNGTHVAGKKGAFTVTVKDHQATFKTPQDTILLYLPFKSTTQKTTKKGAVSVAAVACGILLAGRLSLETLMWMGSLAIFR